MTFESTPSVGIYKLRENAIGFAGLDELAKRLGVKPLVMPHPVTMTLQGKDGQYDFIALMRAFLAEMDAQNLMKGKHE